MSTIGVPTLRIDELAAKYGSTRADLLDPLDGGVLRLHEHPRSAVQAQRQAPQAVNFALDRSELLADVSDAESGRPRTATCRPRSRLARRAPLPAVASGSEERKALAQGHTRSGKAVWYACNDIGLQASSLRKTVKANLKAIGSMSKSTSFSLHRQAGQDRHSRRALRHGGRPYQAPWVDPAQYINVLLDGGRTIQATATPTCRTSTRRTTRVDRSGGTLDRHGPVSRRYASLAVDLAKKRRADGGVHRTQQPLLRIEPRRVLTAVFTTSISRASASNNPRGAPGQ